MDIFRFAHIEYLWGLLIIPFLTIIFIWSRYSRKRALRRFGDEQLISELMPFASESRPVFKFFLIMLALALFIAGTARPQFGSKLKKLKREGIELIIALDVSNSMMAEDIQPNRLERAKRAISRVVDRLKDDRIGLIVFAGEAYIQLPLTSDYNSAKLFLESVNTQIVPRQGTAIGSAINMAVRSFTSEVSTNKVIVIITDGENHEDDPVAAAQEAANNGIVIHTIGMGLPQGSPIPIKSNGQTDYIKDKDGNIVITKLDEVMLEKIATTGNGIYVRANNAQVGLNALFDEVDKLNKEEMETVIFSEYDDQFQYFFAAGIILLLLEFLILERKNRYLMRIKLFTSD